MTHDNSNSHFVVVLVPHHFDEPRDVPAHTGPLRFYAWDNGKRLQPGETRPRLTQ